MLEEEHKNVLISFEIKNNENKSIIFLKIVIL